MDNNTLKTILREYETKRNKAIQDAENRKKELLVANPRLSEIEDQLAKISIETSKAILQTESNEQKKLLADLKKASTKNSISFEYIDTLLSDWHEKALTTVSDVNNYLDSLKPKENKIKPIKTFQTFEYTQSTFDNWEALYDN